MKLNVFCFSNSSEWCMLYYACTEDELFLWGCHMTEGLLYTARCITDLNWTCHSQWKAFLNGAFVSKFPMSCGLVKFKLLWFPGGLASSLVRVYILLSFSCLPHTPPPFSPWWYMHYSVYEPQLPQWVRYGLAYTTHVFALQIHAFCFWVSGTFYAGWPTGEKKTYRYDIVKSEICSAQVWIFLLFLLFISIHLLLPECGCLSS